jgi:hypothetical protein
MEIDSAPLRLVALREIGWTIWDPIGLTGHVGDKFDTGPCDEYDSYLLEAFRMAQEGKAAYEVAEYLTQIASIHMGLSDVEGAAEFDAAKRIMEVETALT